MSPCLQAETFAGAKRLAGHKRLTDDAITKVVDRTRVTGNKCR